MHPTYPQFWAYYPIIFVVSVDIINFIKYYGVVP